MSVSSIDISSVVAIEHGASYKILTVAFTPDGEYLISGGHDGVRTWRVRDGKQIATMEANAWVTSLAISKDGKYIAAGTSMSDVLVWDARTCELVFRDKEGDDFHGVADFSPDASRLVASPGCHTATVWDIAAWKRALTVSCRGHVHAAKYSPEGGRIATATERSVQVWDSSDGRLLVDIAIKVIPCYNTGLLWCNDSLFVVSDETIKEFDVSIGSEVSELPALHIDSFSCIAFAGQGEIIAFSSSVYITFWDSLTQTQLFHTTYHLCGVHSIALSLGNQCLAIATEKRIDIARLSGTINLFSPAVSHPVLQDPGLHIDYTVLHSWKDSRLAHAETLLTTAITGSQKAIHDVFASRALVRTRLGQVNSAIMDAEKSIEIQPSFIGYIAKFVALVGKGKMLEAFRACDIAFQLCHETCTTELLLVKAVVLFMAGEHDDAVERVNDLIKATGVNSPFCLVKGYMHIFIGNQHMSSGNYDHAVESFQRAKAQLDDNAQQPPLVISLVSGWKFDSLGITLRQRLCEAFYAAGRIKEASKALLETVNTLREKPESVATWISDFRSQCVRQLHKHGDVAMEVHQYDKAISDYSATLLLDPPSPQDLLVKRSRAYAASCLWESALIDANKAIELDSSSFSGYERKHAALHGAGRHQDAIDAYETMLFKISQSPDPEMRGSNRYVTPAETKKAIRAAVKRAIDDSPLELINTHSGHLLNKFSRTLSFESQPIFAELISSMTTEIDHAHIECEVTEYYRYATFSHKWEDNEPLFDKVVNVVVYNLDDLPTHQKLQMFCRTVREAGLNWAWSDTCCINKGDHFVLQEALVSMFKWYHGSALTVVFLLGVDQLPEWEDLTKSIWNTRAWTLQEYHASKVVRFYAQDWTPFMNLNVSNHKECPEVIAAMEKATGVSAHALMALRPGLGAIREKLRLASTRDTTRVEDAAYSLLGIFGISLPVTYGEGDRALGRLLAQLLASSGDTSILAWTGRSGSFNSCLPTSITVFKEPPNTHVPLALAGTTAAMHFVGSGLHDTSSIDMTLAIRLHGRLNDLPVPSFSGQRMRLPCLAFKLGRIAGFRGSGRAFRARTIGLGIVELRTTEDLTSLGPLYLVHPWIDFLLDRKPIGTETYPEDTYSGASESTPPVESKAPLFDEDDESLPPPSPVSPVEQEAHVLAFVSRLRQPFGALLLTQTRQNVQEYRRVGSESLITVHVEELTPETMKVLIQSARVLDVL